MMLKNEIKPRLRAAVNKVAPSIFFRSHRLGPGIGADPVSFNYGTEFEESNVLSPSISPKPLFLNYPDSYIEGLNVQCSSAEPSVKSLHNVMYIPYYESLYSSDGYRIPETGLYRGPQQSLVANVPDYIAPRRHLKVIKQPFLYAGCLFHKVYGHLLTECIARLWYLFRTTGMPILCHDLRRTRPWQKDFNDVFYGAVNLTRDQLFSFTSPVLLEEVIVPQPSFTARHDIYEVHRLFPERVAERLLPKTNETTSQPLYFSRSALKGNLRLIVNEKQLEVKLREKGFAIRYPEQLSLGEQIALINRHSVLVGPAGSALHGILFDLSSSRNLVCLAEAMAVNMNCLLIDAVKGVKSVYIGVLTVDPETVHKKINLQNRVLDVDLSLRGLKEIGLI